MKLLHPIKVILSSILVVGFSCISPVMAMTPDGETPAQETVCNSLLEVNVTPGLYGLCVAYCEAHDADIALFSGEILATQTSNEHILDNYNGKMQKGDPSMPCVRVPCPCFDEADLKLIGHIKDRCEDETMKTQIDGRDDDGCQSAAAVSALLKPFRCVYRLDELDGAKCKAVVSIVQHVNPDEYAICRDLILFEAANRGLICK